MKKLIPYLTVTAILYLICSFIPWQFDPSMWGKDTRAFCVFMWIGCMMLTPMVLKIAENEK